MSLLRKNNNVKSLKRQELENIVNSENEIARLTNSSQQKAFALVQEAIDTATQLKNDARAFSEKIIHEGKLMAQELATQITEEETKKAQEEAILIVSKAKEEATKILEEAKKTASNAEEKALKAVQEGLDSQVNKAKEELRVLLNSVGSQLIEKITAPVLPEVIRETPPPPVQKQYVGIKRVAYGA